MAEKRNGAGARLSGVLERSTPPEDLRPLDAEEPEGAILDESAEAPKGRGATARKTTPAPGRTAKRMKGRTIYLPDDLFERIIVQAHRRDKTISEYVSAILERQVPDHRVIRNGPAEGDAA